MGFSAEFSGGTFPGCWHSRDTRWNLCGLFKFRHELRTPGIFGGVPAASLVGGPSVLVGTLCGVFWRILGLCTPGDQARRPGGHRVQEGEENG